MTTRLEDKIKEMRIKQNLLVKQVASKLEMNVAISSKMERSERLIKEEQLVPLADILKADKEEFQRFNCFGLPINFIALLKINPWPSETLKSVSKKVKQGR